MQKVNNVAAKESVLIVGAGPVGLSLAMALIHKGIPVQVFEALPELSRDYRGGAYHPPTLEMFAEWGFLDQVIEQAMRVTEVQYWERSTRELIASFDYSLISEDTTCPFRLHLPQHLLTRILKPLVEASPLGKVHMGHEVVDFVDHGDHVELTCATAGGMRTFQGSYLCGSDGARSTVRKNLGLTFEGNTYEDRFLVINTDINLGAVFPGIGPVCYIFDPKEWVITLQLLKNLRRVVFRVADGEVEEEIVQEANVRERIRQWLGVDIDFNLVQHAVYRVHQRVAGSFRQGRVLLLGDAAHVNNPAGGMGLNSGIHDVYNLVEKLVAVMAGAPEALLDQYSAERRTFALETVQKNSHRNYRDLTAQDEEYRRKRDQELQDKMADRARGRLHLLQFSMMSDRADKRYRIGEFAKRVGLSPATLRRWDNTGKLPARRTANAHRTYGEADIHKARGLTAQER